MDFDTLIRDAQRALQRAVGALDLSYDPTPLPSLTPAAAARRCRDIEEALADISGPTYAAVRALKVLDEDSPVVAALLAQHEACRLRGKVLQAAGPPTDGGPTHPRVGTRGGHRPGRAPGGDYRIVSPYHARVLAALDVAHLSAAVGFPRHTAVWGPAFIGKTECARIHMAHYRHTSTTRTVAHERAGSVLVTTKPVVAFETPAEVRPKAFMRAALEALGDPAPSAGSTDALANRLCERSAEGGVRLLVIDDINHTVERGDDSVSVDTRRTARSVYVMATTLRDLLAQLEFKNATTSVVIMGVNSGQELLNCNGQLQSRFSQIALERLGFDPTHLEDALVFLSIVRSTLRALPLTVDSEMQSFSGACRLHYATGGNVCALADLLAMAVRLANVLGEALTWTHLRRALDQAPWAQAMRHRRLVAGVSDANPFTKHGVPLDAPEGTCRSLAEMFRAAAGDA